MEASNNSSLLRESAVTTWKDDRLDRVTFVRRFAQTLLSSDGSRASGVVVGLTGDWGSGKSTVLNLLAEHLDQEVKQAIVIRFDPWLASGRDDLIASFFSHVVDAIRKRYPNHPWEDRQDQLAHELILAIASYGSYLTSLIDGLSGFSKLISILTRELRAALEKRLKKRSSLSHQKTLLSQALGKFGHPFIVLIDELDRVDDAEVRLMAQLVKSIADFPEISYVIAYDDKRVIEALGSNSPGKRTERLNRGRAYLEKIVQLQMPVPIILPEEIRALLIEELNGTLSQYSPDLKAESVTKLQKLLDDLVPDVLANGRDLRKACSAFRARLPMIWGEVDWVDILAFGVLEIKAPETARFIKRAYDELTFDGRHRNSIAHALKPQSFDDLFKASIPTQEQTPWVNLMLRKLFPARSQLRQSQDCLFDEIAFRRPLLTLLRLSVPPGMVSRETISTFIALPSEKQRDTIEGLLDTGTLDAFLDRLEELHPEVVENDYELWRVLAGIVQDIPVTASEEFLNARELRRAIADMFNRLLRRSARLRENTATILNSMADDGNLILPMLILRSLFFQLGLFGRERRSELEMSRQSVEELAQTIGEKILKWLTERQTFTQIEEPTLVFFLNDVGKWRSELRSKFELEIQRLPTLLDEFVLWAFGGIYSTEKSAIEIFMSPDLFEKLVLSRSELPDWPPQDAVLDAAYKKMADQFDLNLKLNDQSTPA